MRRVSRILLSAGVGAWLGAMLLLSFVLAPTAFSVIGSRHEAGNLVAATLNTMYLASYIIGPALVFVSVVARPAGRGILWALRTILLTLMTLSTVIGREVVGARLVNLRRAMGAMIEAVPADDPVRLLFNQWHQFSVFLMLFNIIAAVTVLLFLSLESSDERRR